MTYIVLLGDSVFDNAAYVAGGPDVVRQLRDLLPPEWRATLNARDGAVLADIPQQLQGLSSDATHLVVSAAAMTHWERRRCSMQRWGPWPKPWS